MARLFVLLAVGLCAAVPNETAFGQGPPIRGEGGGVQYFQGNVFRTWAEWTDMQSPADPQAKNVLTYRQQHVLSFVPSPGLALRVMVPLVSKHFSGSASGVLPDSITGLGDTMVSAKYRVYFQTGKGTRFDLGLVGGVKLPTGNKDKVDSSGNRLPRPMQLGTGSVDPLWKITGSFADGPRGYSLFANLSQTLASEADGYEFGNRWSAVIGIRKRVLPLDFARAGNTEFYGELALIYGDQAKHLDDGQVVPNTGRRSSALAPGVTFIFQSMYLLEFSARFPLSQSYSGEQLEESWNSGIGFRVIY